jgi:predicted signal transduction protein with EAL and GGDEF domain
MHLKHAFRQLKSLFCVQPDNKDLLRAQFEAFQKQVPLLYMILIVNSMSLAYNFRNAAPAILSIWTPIFLCTVCALRLVIWTTRRKVVASDAEVLKHMRLTNKLAGVIAIFFSVWDFALFPYASFVSCICARPH